MNETEKYGVDEEEDDAKTAADKKNICPKCGSVLRPREVTGVLLCPKCGSSPFEAGDESLNGPNKRK